MNNARRKRIRLLAAKISDISGTLEALHNELNDICNEENDAFDNMPEGLQDSYRGEEIQRCIDCLEEALGYFEEFDTECIIDCLNECVE